MTRDKNCFCWNCKKPFHYLGIARHRKEHLNNGESVRITFTGGETYSYQPKKKNTGGNNNATAR